jgi:hypothetical protein
VRGVQLSGLLEKLKGLFSTALLISSVLPLFCFVLVSAVILAQYSESANAWLQGFLVLDTAPKTAVAAFGSLGLLVLAYIFSTFNLGLREVLEGKHLKGHLLKWATTLLEQGQIRRLGGLQGKVDTLRQTRYELMTQRLVWIEDLRKARLQGEGKDKVQCVYPANDATHAVLGALHSKRWRSETIGFDELKSAADSLKKVLQSNSADLDNNGDSQRLDCDHTDFIGLMDYAYKRIEAEYTDAYNEREFNFSRFTVASTQMGNIAESVRGYTLSRYSMNLDFFWTRFQKVLQGDAAFYQTLQDAKTQLDFAVSMFWLTVATWVIWGAALPFLSHTWLPFLFTWVAGPVLIRMWYLLAVQNYRSFADLLRSAVDLFRLALLTEFKIPLPADIAAEKEIWDSLNRKFCYGENIFFTYNADKP